MEEKAGEVKEVAKKEVGMEGDVKVAWEEKVEEEMEEEGACRDLEVEEDLVPERVEMTVVVWVA